MARRMAVLLGVALGVTAGWLAAQRHMTEHREDLFSPHPLRRFAALGALAGGGRIETIQLLRDYLAWERHPVLRRRAAGMVRRLEAALG